MNPKYEVGQKIPVSCILTITGVQHKKGGSVSYNTDRVLTIPEYLLEQIEMKPYENPYHATEAQPAQEEPAQPEAEPIKLYCVKDYNGLCHRLRKGEVYEWHDGALCVLGEHQFTTNKTYEEWAKNNSGYAECLIPLVSRPAKVGEWVLVTGLCAEDNLSGGMKVGDISNVVRLNDNFGVYIRAHKKSVFGLTEDGPVTLLRNAEPQYLVLDGYKPEPEYLNMRVVCVDNGFIINLTVGKVYEVKDGFFYNDAGRKNPIATGAIETLNDMNARHAAKFIEFKGE